MDLATVPLAITPQATVDQVRLVEPGTGWFCYAIGTGPSAKPVGCFRASDDCKKSRDEGASAFGSAVPYGLCERRPQAECFVFRHRAQFVTPNVRAQCEGTHEGCEQGRKIFAENAKTTVGPQCVPVE